MKPKVINSLQDNCADFTKLKEATERYWLKAGYTKCWGVQVQEGSKWKKGLTDAELDAFEAAMGITFPDVLRGFYKTMNGLDRPGVDFKGDVKAEPGLKPAFYSYPDDLPSINQQIDRICEDNNITRQDMLAGKVPFIIPVYGHRCLVFDGTGRMLSMVGRDIIIYADNIARAIAKDVFEYVSNEVIPANLQPVPFWLENPDGY
ncbi:SMI1/KNR4 family protein [Flavobacterium akiainvivens]|nr:SMI1/KNR4 family protein [Flavobacterium akiainvivens]SFQ68675.1 SMI1 / KNR4 family (SUKH-1) [Flavobacterium akiainvivens]